VIEDAAAISANEEIGEAIVVVVAYCDSHSEQTLCADTSFGRNVGKGSISIVAIESTAQRPAWSVDLRSRAVYKVKVQQAILIVVNPCTAGAHGLDEEFFG
jgi:hypothetical protein